MSAEERFVIPDEEWRVLPEWYGQAARLLLLAGAWLAFELTADPSLAVVVACSQFGWNYFLTGLWIREVDPDRVRGKTVSWFCFASAFWNVTVASFLAMFGIIILFELTQAHRIAEGQEMAFESAITLLVGLSCFSALALTTLIAVVLARVRGVVVWVDSTLHHFRRMERWPLRPYGENVVARLVTTSLLLPVIFGVFVLLACLLAGEIAALNWLIVFLLLSMFGLMSAREWAQWNVAAKTPRRCWSPGDV